MDWLVSNAAGARFVRTVIEAALAWLVANMVVVLAGFDLDPATVSGLSAVLTAALSPVLASLRKIDEEA